MRTKTKAMLSKAFYGLLSMVILTSIFYWTIAGVIGL